MGVQAVLGLIEDDALRALDDLGADLFLAMRGQAVHEDGVSGRRGHEFGRHAVGQQRRGVALGQVLVAHRRPDVGVDDVDVAHRAVRAAEGARRARAAGFAQLAEMAEEGFARAMRRRAPEGDRDPAHHRRFGQRLGHVVARVADVGQPQPRERAEALADRQQVADRLAGVRRRRQAVDDRDGRRRREPLERLVGMSADHDRVDEAREHAGSVLGRLAGADHEVRSAGEERVPAQLRHRDLERDARAQARLLEEHRQRLPAEEGKLVRRAARLDVAGEREDRSDLGR